MYAQGFLTKLQLGQKKAENATFLKDPRFANSTPPLRKFGLPLGKFGVLPQSGMKTMKINTTMKL